MFGHLSTSTSECIKHRHDLTMSKENEETYDGFCVSEMPNVGSHKEFFLRKLKLGIYHSFLISASIAASTMCQKVSSANNVYFDGNQYSDYTGGCRKMC